VLYSVCHELYFVHCQWPRQVRRLQYRLLSHLSRCLQRLDIFTFSLFNFSISNRLRGSRLQLTYSCFLYSDCLLFFSYMISLSGPLGPFEWMDGWMDGSSIDRSIDRSIHLYSVDRSIDRSIDSINEFTRWGHVNSLNIRSVTIVCYCVVQRVRRTVIAVQSTVPANATNA